MKSVNANFGSPWCKGWKLECVGALCDITEGGLPDLITVFVCGSDNADKVKLISAF